MVYSELFQNFLTQHTYFKNTSEGDKNNNER